MAQMNIYEDHINPTFEPDEPNLKQAGVQDNYYDVPEGPKNSSKRLCCMIAIISTIILVGIAGTVLGVVLSQPDMSDPNERNSTLPTTETSTKGPEPPKKPSWTTWGSWDECDVTCGGGVQQRSRICNGLSRDNTKTCAGKQNEQQKCATWICPDCNYNCTFGILNAACDACECGSSILRGRVTDENNRPLSGATVVYAFRPYVNLATTNSTGMFAISGVCASSQLILVRKPMFTTVEKSTITQDAITSTVSVILQRMELPFISGQPQDKIRQTGESVKFCCMTESNSPITKIEWFKNGDIIESANADNESLVIHDLNSEDSGSYTCRVQNGGGSIYSEAAVLAVEESNTGCSSDPVPRLIRLPDDCVQPETNKAEFDVGTCGQTECYGVKTDQTLCSDMQKEFHCCQPVLSQMVNLSCTGYTLPVSKVTSCGCGACTSQTRKIFGHVISAESGDDLAYIAVYYNSEAVTSTNPQGIFTFELSTQVRRVALTLKDDINFNRRVADTSVVFEIQTDVVIHQVIKMKAIPEPVIVERSSVENCLPLAGDGLDAVAELVIAPNSMYNSDGTMYNGSFNAAIINFDMRNRTDAESAPGDFKAVDEEGNVVPLRSFGMFAFSFTDLIGNRLAIGGSSMVRVNQEMIPSCEFDDNGNCDTSLWVLNERTSLWEMASSLSESTSTQKRQTGGGLNGEIDVVEYQLYNIDDFDTEERCWAKVIAYVSENFNPGGLLPYNFMVTSIIEEQPEQGVPFLRRAVVTGHGYFSNIGVCVPQACDMSNPDDSRFTTLLSATFDDESLRPAESTSLSPNFSLNQMDISNLNYQTVKNSKETLIQMKPFPSDDGPIFLGKTSGYETCGSAGIESKHFQFYCETCDDILCYTANSAAVSPQARTYLTFYPLLPPLTGQRYCFIGLRIYTNAPVVQVIATSAVGSFAPTNNEELYYGRREILARKNTPESDYIDACMEFKCSGTIFDPSIGSSDISDTPKVTIDVKGGGFCSATSILASDFEITIPTYLPFTFEDPRTYGLNQGVHRINQFNNIPICTNDLNSPQTADTGHCEIEGHGFVPALEITCL